MGARLKSLAGDQSFALEDFNLIGRSEQANIRVYDHGISRQHATIRHEGGQYWLVDLGSSNGTYVNDFSVTQAHLLRDGDRLQLGTAVFTFLQDATANMAVSLQSQTLVLPRHTVPMRTVPATLLVADLKGYTALSAALSAGEVAELLREWYGRCRTSLNAHGAVLDKFIGDCVFAYWPIVKPETRRAAVQVARELRTSTDTIAIKVDKLREHPLRVECCIGLHVGEVALGSMGGSTNTALGDAVNLAFRIESLTRKIQCGVLASAQFLDGAGDIEELFENRGMHEIKGHPEKVSVFSLKE